MKESLRAQFMPRFLELARQRLERGQNALSDEPTIPLSQLPADMHSLAGDAAMLGLTDVAAAARDCEAMARLCATGREHGVTKDCVDKLEHLIRLVDEIAAQ